MVIFQRGLDPKHAMGIGIYANPTKVRCIKNKYLQSYHRLQFTRKQIYEVKRAISMENCWIIFDCYNRPFLYPNKRFKEYFKIVG